VSTLRRSPPAITILSRSLYYTAYCETTSKFCDPHRTGVAQLLTDLAHVGSNRGQPGDGGGWGRTGYTPNKHLSYSLLVVIFANNVPKCPCCRTTIVQQADRQEVLSKPIALAAPAFKDRVTAHIISLALVVVSSVA
jgi:hypothetical protein